MTHVVHAEGRDFRARYRLSVSEACLADCISASSETVQFKYHAFGDGEPSICKGPDGEPWIAFTEGDSYYVGGGNIRGPFVYRWNGAAWTAVTGPTADGGVGTEQSAGTTQDTTHIEGGGGGPSLWVNGLDVLADPGSYATGGQVGFPAKDALRNPWICCDDSNVYVTWNHLEQWDNGAVYDFRKWWRVRRWDGAAWTELGATANTHYGQKSNTLTADAVGSAVVKMVANSTGVYVLYVDKDDGLANSGKTYVAHWNGAAWTDLGGGSIPDLDGLDAPFALDLAVDSAGRPTVFWGGYFNIGGFGDYAFASTADGGVWTTSSFQIAFPNLDIPAGIANAVEACFASPEAPTGDFVVGAHCVRDTNESYFFRYDPDGGAWTVLDQGAKLTHRIVGFQVFSPEGDHLWLSTVNANNTGPVLWEYVPTCHRWLQMDYIDGAGGPTTASSTGVVYRDGNDFYVMNNIPNGTDGAGGRTDPYTDQFIWHGTMTRNCGPETRCSPFGSAPPNDDFADAMLIAGASGSTAPIDINQATVEVDEPTGSCLTFGPVAQTVWFKWVAPSGDAVTFNTADSRDACDDLPDTTLTVWTGNALNALTQIACDDDSGPGFTSTLTFTPSGGTTYYIQFGVAYPGVACGSAVLTWF